MGWREERASGFDCLSWVRDRGLLARLIAICRLGAQARFLDMGAGTGAVARAAVASGVREATALDKSPAMARAFRSARPNGTAYVLADARRMPLADKSVDVAAARMMLHHLTEGLDRALAEVFRVLTPGGAFVACEGLCPDARIREAYREILLMKEDRVFFEAEDLRRAVAAAGLRVEEEDWFVVRQMSVRNWLENDPSLDGARRQAIMDRHRGRDEVFRRAYNLRETEDDVFIDIRFHLLRGRKP